MNKNNTTPERQKVAKRMVVWVVLMFLFAWSAIALLLIIGPGPKKGDWIAGGLWMCTIISLDFMLYYFVKQWRT